MKKLFISAILITAILFSFQAKAILYVANYTGIQHNIWFYGSGTNYGVSATTGITTYTSHPPPTGFSWIMTQTGIPTLSGAPMESLFVGEVPGSPYLGMETSVEIYPPMTTNYTVQYFVPAGSVDIYITFYP